MKSRPLSEWKAIGAQDVVGGGGVNTPSLLGVTCSRLT